MSRSMKSIKTIILSGLLFANIPIFCSNKEISISNIKTGFTFNLHSGAFIIPISLATALNVPYHNKINHYINNNFHFFIKTKVTQNATNYYALINILDDYYNTMGNDYANTMGKDYIITWLKTNTTNPTVISSLPNDAHPATNWFLTINDSGNLKTANPSPEGEILFECNPDNS